MSGTKYKVSEIFDSIEGEGKRAGELVTFIRLTGCNLRCSYCDTAYAFDGGEYMTIKEIKNRITYKKVTITGGEPLSYHLIPLLDALKGYEVNIETNGSFSILPYINYRNVFFTVDFKCESSGMTPAMNYRNYDNLRSQDVLKFVVGTENDLKQAESMYIFHYKNLKNKLVYVSPVFGKIKPADIVEFIKREQLPWRIQLQLHKFIWDPQKRGV